jgi:hypothetical protein
MKGALPIPPLRDLPPGRLAQRSAHLLFEIAPDRESRGASARRWPSRWGRPSRRRLTLVLAAATLLVVIGTASAFGVRALFLDRGFIGLPPEGATPSSPENAELVVNFYGRSSTLGGSLSRAWVYADGRMIWHREGQVPEGANKSTSGFLEQRLTPEGVELLRSKVLASGLFRDDLTLLSQRFGQHDSVWGTVRVRNGNRLISVDWEDPGIDLQKDDGTIATPEQVNALVRVDALVTNAAAWLPASAWEDRKIRAYVPSRYAVCLAEAGSPLPIEPSSFLPLLPETAQVLLRAREFAPAPWGGPPCTDLTTEEARALGQALTAAGLEQFKDRRIAPYVLAYRLEIPGPTRAIIFEPYLPHGEITCSACG